MNDNGQLKKGAAYVVGGVMFIEAAGYGLVFERHPCRDFKTDASCREQSDTEPNRVPYPLPTNNQSLSARVTAISTGTVELVQFPSLFSS